MFGLRRNLLPNKNFGFRRFLSTSFTSPLLNNLPTAVSSLPNGVRVATQDAPGHFVAAGVYVGTGSRNQTDDLEGACHLMDRMAFRSTKDYSSLDLVQNLEKLGGNILAHSSREAMAYQSTIFPQDLPKMLEIFSQIIRYPQILPEELDESKVATLYELDDLKYNFEMRLPEELHSIAFGGTSVGRSMVCKEENLAGLTADSIKKFRDLWYTPSNIVVAGVGMKHEVLYELAEKYFGDMQKESEEILRLQNLAKQSVQYVGNTLIYDSKNDPPNPNPDMPTLTHVLVGFESLSSTDPDIYALATLASLMGGGGSFSAGGPGKGMHTRLYTQVLNQNYWVENCSMLNFTYLDTGIFGINMAIAPSAYAHSNIINVIVNQLIMMRSIDPQELSRAKNQLKSQLLMGLESKIAALDDIGRQILSHGKRIDVHEICRRIDLVTVADISRVVERVVLGSNEKSPLNFGEDVDTENSVLKSWKRTGDGRPSILVHGPLRDNDPLKGIEWGLRNVVLVPIGGKKWTPKTEKLNLLKRIMNRR